MHNLCDDVGLPESFQPRATVRNSESRVVRVSLSKTEKSTSTAFYLGPISEATLDDTAPEDTEMSRLLDRSFYAARAKVSATRGLHSCQDLRLALHETVSSCPHESEAA